MSDPSPHAAATATAKAKRKVAIVIGCSTPSSDVTDAPRDFDAPLRHYVDAHCGRYLPRCACAAADRRPRLFGDAAAALRLRRDRRDLTVDLVMPSEVTRDRVAAADATFLLGYDSQSAALDAASRATQMVSAAEGRALRDAVTGSARVHPSPALQAFGICKRVYYERALAAGVPIAPTAFARSAKERAPAAIAAVARSRGWDQFFVKPAVGSWSGGVERFDLASPTLICDVMLHVQSALVRQSPDIVIQQFMPGFYEHPEVRCFWGPDGDFLYAVANWQDGALTETVQQGEVPERYLRGAQRVGRMVLKMLPERPVGVVRTDIACQSTEQGSLDFFMNEVDVRPGMYYGRAPGAVEQVAAVLSAAVDRVLPRSPAADAPGVEPPAKRARGDARMAAAP